MKGRKNKIEMCCASSTFSEQIHWLLYRGPALSLMMSSEGSWLAGLCWILAEGILRWITLSQTLSPVDACLVMIGDERCPAHHVVVCVRMNQGTDHEKLRYLDANGVSTRSELLGYWQDIEQLTTPFLAPYDAQRLLEYDIPRDDQMSTRVAGCFLAMFGWFSPAFLDGDLTSPKGHCK